MPSRRASGRLAQDDESLSRQALAGDPAAWDVLIERHNHRVVLSLLAAGVRIGEAREVAQEAWMRLLLKQRAGDLAELKLPGLVIAQAGWLARDARRKQQRHLHLLGTSVDADTLPLRSEQPDPERRLLGARDLQRAVDALQQCPPRQREVFLAAYDSSVPHEELADTFGISVQRLRQILWEVRRRLRGAVGMVSEERSR